MYEHGTLYEVTVPGYDRPVEIIVRDDRVVCTGPVLRWLRSASGFQLMHEARERGWRMVAVRAATKDDHYDLARFPLMHDG
jgi:hypothetical protein